MAVIVQLRVPADAFELGRVLRLEPETTIDLETMVPLGQKAVPFFSVSEEVRDTFQANVRDHPSVQGITQVSIHNGETLYSLEWDVKSDDFFAGIMAMDGQLLDATGTVNTWEFEIRFPSHELMSEFQEHCLDANIPLEVGRVFNPARPGTGQWYGLTPAQRTTLVRAVEGGYYSIPRDMSTRDLADVLEISDQAVTERLRRGIMTLVQNTLIAMEEEEETEYHLVE